MHVLTTHITGLDVVFSLQFVPGVLEDTGGRQEERARLFDGMARFQA